jgi:hypothetical protein
MVSDIVTNLLIAKPEYRKTFELAVTEEEEHSNDQHYLGWEWYKVETHPSKLMRLVTEGIARINFKSNSSTNYVLKDREAVKQALTHLDARREVAAKRKAQSSTN